MVTSKTPKLTKIRQAALAVLQGATYPLSANEIFSLILLPCNPVTIYRTLHYLEEKGFTHSFVLHCSEHGTERYYTITPPDNQHHHWFHCEQCHHFIDLGNCDLHSLIQDYEAKLGIEVTSHTLYLTGNCAACKARLESSITQ